MIEQDFDALVRMIDTAIELDGWKQLEVAQLKRAKKAAARGAGLARNGSNFK